MYDEVYGYACMMEYFELKLLCLVCNDNECVRSIWYVLEVIS